jgi:hypothetical protein
MKLLFGLFIFLSGSLCIHAQISSYTKSIAISSLNAKAKEANGNIRFFSSKGEKVTIEDASFTATEMGVKIAVTLIVGKSKTMLTSEFNPADITTIMVADFPDESPVGQVKINLDYKIGHRTSYHKSDGLVQTYEDAMTFNFLKVDEDNAEEIRALLFRLKEIYAEGYGQPLKPISKMMNKSDDFWISTPGASNTYELMRVYVTGCTMRLVYYLKSIGTAGDKTRMYLTIIPFADIDDVRLDKSKSKPNCIMLQSGKKGFETYEFKDKIYVPTTAVKEVPLFIDVSYDWRRDEVMEELKKQVRECGGGKIKL